MEEVRYGTVNPEGLEFIFEHTRDVPEKQLASGERTDTKAIQIFTAASFVTGLAGIGALGDTTETGVRLCLLGVLSAYIAVLWFVFHAIRPRDWRGNDHATWLWDNCYHLSADQLRHSLTSQIKSTVAHNDQVLARKVFFLEASLFAAALVVAFMIVGVHLAAS